MDLMQFTNKLIPYEKFLRDVAAEVVCMIKSDANDPEYLSQSVAWRMFGRRNVERWVREGKIEPSKLPGSVQYKTAELRKLQRKDKK